MTYSYRLRVLAESFLLVSFIVVPLSVNAGVLSFIFGPKTSAATEETLSHSTYSLIDAPVLSATQNPNPQGGRGGYEIVVDEGALVSSGPIGENVMATTHLTNGEIAVYTVREGDALSQIAEMFGVTTNTILWANDLTSARAIKPGDTLVILPIAGVRHTVKSGDTISSIAKEYKGNEDEIIQYNQLAGGALEIGSTVIVPGGAIAAAPVAATARATGGSVSSASGFIHPVPGGVRSQGVHGYNAVDLAAPAGTPIRAAAAGEVIVAKTGGWNGGYGNYIVIKHSNGTQTLYSHNQSNTVGVGAYVAQGETIGYVGSTGRSTGAHLHFEVRGARNPF